VTSVERQHIKAHQLVGGNAVRHKQPERPHQSHRPNRAWNKQTGPIQQTELDSTTITNQQGGRKILDCFVCAGPPRSFGRFRKRYGMLQRIPSEFMQYPLPEKNTREDSEWYGIFDYFIETCVCRNNAI
jgi:hypothetical protein